MNAGIVEYSSSDDEDDNDSLPQVSLTINNDSPIVTEWEKSTKFQLQNCNLKKRENSNIDEHGHDDIKRHKKNVLPLPAAIQNMFKEEEKKEDTTKHGGRLRTFEHVVGNWASYVYIPFKAGELFDQFVEEIITCLEEYEFEAMSEYHLSLSRTVTIRHHWIDSLTKLLKSKLHKLNSSICAITDCKFYTNDEKTRTFVSLQVSDPSEKLDQLRMLTDESFEEFNLPKYYENPSYHISIGWCLGDVVDKIQKVELTQVQKIVQSFIEENRELSVCNITEVQCKTGNRVFTFPLLNS